LEQSATPLAAFDMGRRIVFASPSLGEWLGVEPDKLVGQRADYHAGGDDPVAAAAAAICPPPDAFAGLASSGQVSRPATAERPFERRAAHFVRVGGRSDDETLLLAFFLEGDAPAPGDSALSPERLHTLLAELRSRQAERFQISQLVGQSDALRRVREQAQVAAQSRVRVLVVGPAGSGREHVARAIHLARGGHEGPGLVPIACPLVDPEQMQGALAAVLRRQYESPAAPPPVALLLDVDQLRPSAQQELAGFLRLPGIELHTLATAERPLAQLAAKGKFLPELAYGLSTLVIELPPLVKRREDIPLLAQHFLERENAAGGRQLSGFAPAASELLASLSWAGNLDELAVVVREACQRAAGREVALADLPDTVRVAAGALRFPARTAERIELDVFLAEVERELFERALAQARGNKSKAAQLLGISRARLLRRLVQLGIEPPPGRAQDEPVIFEPVPEEPA
jgi:hypothetical protein